MVRSVSTSQAVLGPYFRACAAMNMISGIWDAPAKVHSHAACLLLASLMTTLLLMVHCFIYYPRNQRRAQQPRLSSPSNPPSCPASHDLADGADSDSSCGTSSSHWGTDSDPGIERLRSWSERGALRWERAASGEVRGEVRGIIVDPIRSRVSARLDPD